MALTQKYVLNNDYNSTSFALNPESFCFSLISLKKVCSSAETLSKQFYSLNDYASLLNEAGFDLSGFNKKASSTNVTLSDLLDRMNNTRAALEKADASLTSLFDSIEAQFNLTELFEFGDLESETDIQLFWENIKQIYYAVKDKDPASLTELEKYAVDLYTGNCYDILDLYNDVQAELAPLQEEYETVCSEYYNMCTDGFYGTTEYDTELANKYLELTTEINALKAKSKEYETILKEKGLMEYSAWEQITMGFKEMHSLRLEAQAALNAGDYDAYNELCAAYSTKFFGTGAIVLEKTVAGVLKVGEWLIDGTYTLSALSATNELRMQAAEYAADATLNSAYDFVARDLVGEAESWFYNKTSAGQWINNNSVLKYDSAGANVFKSIGTKAAEIGLAYLTGGAFAFALGALEGFGEGAEHQFNITDENGDYTRRNATGLWLAGLKGLGKGAEWYGYSQAVSGIKQGVDTFKTLGKDGLKTIVGSISSDTAKEYLSAHSKELAARAFKKMWTDADTYMDAGCGVVNFITSGIESKEWNWKELFFDVGLSFVGNYVGAFGGTYLEDIMSYKYLDSEYAKKFAEYDELASAGKERLAKANPIYVEIYEDGQATGVKYQVFGTYEEHNYVHVTRVADEALSTNECLTILIADGKTNGLGFLDEGALELSGLGHDTGMREGCFAIVYFENFDDDGKLIEKGFKKIALVEDDITSGNKIRKAHPSASATTSLHEGIGGDDKEFIAALEFLHSKSNSGVKQITSNAELEEMLMALYNNAGYEKYNYTFDITKFGTYENGVFTIDPDVAAQLKTGAIALRVGDARALKTGFTHGGDLIDIQEWCSCADVYDYLKSVDNSADVTLEQLIEFELKNSDVKLVDINGNVTSASSDWIMGERNWKSLGETVEDGMLTYHDQIVSSANPACTIDKGVAEKFGEYASFGDAVQQKVVLHFPTLEDGSVDKKLIDFYKDFLPSSGNWGKLNIDASDIVVDYDQGILSFVFGGY